MSRKVRNRKGRFGPFRLPVARDYVRPPHRRKLLWLGAGLAALLGAWVLVDFFARDAAFISNGPLSSSHADLEHDCAACHASVGDSAGASLAASRSVTSESCSVCHEKLGDELGVYSFSSHYLYRSGDFQRLVPSEHEMACFSCHTEHLGREAAITTVPDARCETCHDFASFNRGHPQFDVVAESIPDSGALTFTHIHHVREVMDTQSLEDVERSCLYCHNPGPDGRSFQPIEFDRHCDACHLTTTTSTPRLPIAEPGDEAAVGVLTLAALREADEPGLEWASYVNPAEFRERGSGVQKTPVYHQDPWVLDNLRRLRRRLHPDAGLADLLRASADVPASDVRVLYEEAVATLKSQMLGLRASPEGEVQKELRQMEELLRRLEQALRDPYTPLDETEFLLALDGPRNPDLSSEQAAEIETLIGDLTQPCQTCHRVRDATITRVQKDQRVLRRAEFDHRAHILQRRCLDCHQQIPILESLAATEEIDAALDRAEIQNLPAIEGCQECHTPKAVSNRCVTCHLFHPDKSRRSELLLYLQ